jgi:hypothetical protein
LQGIDTANNALLYACGGGAAGKHVHTIQQDAIQQAAASTGAVTSTATAAAAAASSTDFAAASSLGSQLPSGNADPPYTEAFNPASRPTSAKKIW